MDRTPHRPSPCPGPTASGRGRRRGFTLAEIIVVMALTGLLMTIVATQMLESASMSLRITRTLEHSRSSRELIDVLTADVRSAQVMRLYPDFSDRSAEARDGQVGNYLVLQSVDVRGSITRTVGYYVVKLGNGRGWTLHRHDSALGDNAAESLPEEGTVGQHRTIKRAVRLPDSNTLFRCTRDLGVTIHGEFGAIEGGGRVRSEFIRCTIATRS